MIQVVAHLGPGEFSLTISGHHEGDPRVCAAVSAISQTALLGLLATEENDPQHIRCTITEKEGTS